MIEVLPAPVAPTKATVWPAFTSKRNIAQHVLFVVVSKPHVLERHIASWFRALSSPVSDINSLLSSKLHDSFGTYYAQLQGIKAVGNLPDGPEKHGNVHDKGNERTQRYFLIYHAPGPVPHQQAGTGSANYFGHRKINRIIKHRPDIGLGCVPGLFSEISFLRGLRC